MSKQSKESFVSTEKEEEQNSEAKTELELLKEENEELKFTIKEQKRLIKEMDGQLNGENEERSSNVKPTILERESSILNDLCERKEKEIKILEEKLEKLTSVLKHQIQHHEKKSKNDASEQDKLITAKRLIIQLTEENEEYEQRLDRFLAYTESFIDWIENNVKNPSTLQLDFEGSEKNERQKFHKFERERLYMKIKEFRRKIKVAQSLLVDEEKEENKQKEMEKDVINVNEDYSIIKYQLSNAYETIANLTRKIEKLESENKALKKKEQEHLKTLNGFKNKLKQNQQEIDFQKNDKNKSDKELYKKITIEAANLVPNPLDLDFFEFIFHVNHNLLADYNKKILFHILSDLLDQSTNRELIRMILKLLRGVKNPDHSFQLKEFATHQDWIVRLSLANSLKDYYVHHLIEEESLLHILETLIQDDDPDVRNAAIQTIKSLKNL
ncbi:MAG: HEAT repeat domain-containing protein [Promethearchaeia archaeon]